jgi:hypothetical protein
MTRSARNEVRLPAFGIRISIMPANHVHALVPTLIVLYSLYMCSLFVVHCILFLFGS